MPKAKQIPVPHPGETLLEDFMQPLGLTQYRVAKDLGVAPLRINQIIRGQRAISADTALRLARYTGTSPQFWLNLQLAYDLRKAESSLAGRIVRAVQGAEGALHKGCVFRRAIASRFPAGSLPHASSSHAPELLTAAPLRLVASR